MLKVKSTCTQYVLYTQSKGNERKHFRVTANCVGYSPVAREVEPARQQTAINKIHFLILRGGKCRCPEEVTTHKLSV
ncbi:hypothetical protein PGIGA_G00146570 [Pangasianodon gigas]|uniref:Uncharacterized protein n=1 Tax=Pangasianodon gigas TaxID=30993 RepID=A0ACC5XMU1_PANGG|nr:hypothetical protein [Pangasianodon gigas]